MTLTSIGKIFNKRHGTVLNALQKASDLMSYDVAYKISYQYWLMSIRYVFLESNI